MQRRSWIVLGICAVLAVGLFVAYLSTRGGDPKLTQEGAVEIVQKMGSAFHDKDTTGVMEYISPAPDTRLAGLTQDQARLLLAKFFRNTDQVSTEMKNFSYLPGETDATLQFDLSVLNGVGAGTATDYHAHITVHFKRVDVPHLLGIYQTREWRVAGIESNGPDVTSFGD